MFSFIEGLEVQRYNFVQRKKEIEEVCIMLKMRADAEMNYANALYRISDRDSNDTIKIGLLSQEVNCFKSSCLSKAKSSEELAINI